jgi:hypothetical protein
LLLLVVELVVPGTEVVVEPEVSAAHTTFPFQAAATRLLSALAESELPMDLPNRLRGEIQVPLVSP